MSPVIGEELVHEVGWNEANGGRDVLVLLFARPQVKVAGIDKTEEILPSLKIIIFELSTARTLIWVGDGGEDRTEARSTRPSNALA